MAKSPADDKTEVAMNGVSLFDETRKPCAVKCFSALIEEDSVRAIGDGFGDARALSVANKPGLAQVRCGFDLALGDGHVTLEALFIDGLWTGLLGYLPIVNIPKIQSTAQAIKGIQTSELQVTLLVYTHESYISL